MKIDKSKVINLEDQIEFGHLRYQIAYKTVGNTDFFKDEQVRHVLWDCLDRQAILSQVKLEHVQIFDYAIDFIIEAPITLDLHKFLMHMAQALINTVNKAAPELHLKQMAPSGTLSRLWHRPYYIKTLDSIHVQDLDDYLK